MDTTAQSYLNRSTSWYVEFLDNLPLGIYRTTLEGKLVFCNRAFAKMFEFDSVRDFNGYPVVNLYRDKKNRGDLIRDILKHGYVQDVCIPFKNMKGSTIWCSLSAKAVFDDDGMVVFLDGVMRDVTHDMRERKLRSNGQDMLKIVNGFMMNLSPTGELIDVNQDGAEFFDTDRTGLVGESLLKFIGSGDKELFPVFLSEVMDAGQGEEILMLRDGNGKEQPVEFHGFLAGAEGNPKVIKAIVRFVNARIKRQNEQLTQEKFEGVLEMAGGVSHRLNQPLTIINNLLSEVMADLGDGEHPENYEKLAKVHGQIKNLNEIARKIRSIKKYEAMEYVGGIKIVDIDKAS